MTEEPWWKRDLQCKPAEAGKPIPDSMMHAIHQAAHFFGAHGLRAYEPAWIAKTVAGFTRGGLVGLQRSLSYAEASALNIRMDELRALVDGPAIVAALRRRQTRLDADEAELLAEARSEAEAQGDPFYQTKH